MLESGRQVLLRALEEDAAGYGEASERSRERNRSVCELHEAGLSDTEIAKRLGVGLTFVRKMRRQELERASWPVLRRRLAPRTRSVLVGRFGGDWSVFADPERIVRETSQAELLKCQGMGVRRVVELTRELRRLGYELALERPRRS